MTVYVAELEKGGQWVAYTTESPYFCVQAESEKAVTSLARRAREFYTRVLDRHGGALPIGQISQKAQVRKRLSEEELAAA